MGERARQIPLIPVERDEQGNLHVVDEEDENKQPMPERTAGWSGRVSTIAKKPPRGKDAQAGKFTFRESKDDIDEEE